MLKFYSHMITLVITLVIIFHFTTSIFAFSVIERSKLYTQEENSLEDATAGKAYRKAAELYKTFSNIYFSAPVTTTADGQFEGEIIQIGNEMALSITHLETKKVYYHFPEDSIDDEVNEFKTNLTSKAFPTNLEKNKLYAPKNLLTQTSAKEAYKKGLELYNIFLTKGHHSTHATTADNKYRGEIIPVGHGVALEITNLDTNETYHHFADDGTDEIINQFKASLSSKVFDLRGKNRNNYARYLKKIDELNIVTQKSRWDVESLIIQDEIKYLYSKLRQEWERQKHHTKQHDDEWFFNQHIDKNKVFYNEKGVGSAKLTAIDGKLLIRIVHERSELSFGLATKGEIDFNSAHFKQYVARQHIDSGLHREDGIFGRDFVMIQLEDLSYDPSASLVDRRNYETFLKYEAYSKQWWIEYWRATKKAVTLADFKFGIICGVIQGAIIFSMGHAINYATGGIAVNTLEPALFTAAWGTVFGAITPTFKNWVKRGPKVRRGIKNMANGILFQYFVTGLLNPMGIVALDPRTLLGLLENFKIFGESFISNQAKPNWYNFVNIRDSMGTNRGNFKSTSIRKSNIEHQAAYAPNFIWRYAGRSNVGIPKDSIFSSLIGVGIISTAVPVSEYAALRYLRRLAHAKKPHPAAVAMYKKAQNDWDFKKLLFKDVRLDWLLLKKFYYKLSFRPKQKEIVHALLVKKYPKHFQLPPEHVENNRPHTTSKFTLPGQGENADCTRLLRPFFTSLVPQA